MVDLDVDIEQVVDGILEKLLLATVLLETQCQYTVLLAPVTEVVDANHIPASGLVEVGEETANDGASQVTGVEGFGNVGRGELDDDALLSLGRVVGVLETENLVAAIFRLVGPDQRDNGTGEGFGFEKEWQEVAILNWLVNEG